MPTIIDFGAFLIRLYAGEHGRPHVHVLGADFAAVVDIATGDILAGSLPAVYRRRALSWITDHGAELRLAWDSLNSPRNER